MIVWSYQVLFLIMRLSPAAVASTVEVMVKRTHERTFLIAIDTINMYFLVPGKTWQIATCHAKVVFSPNNVRT